MSGKEVSEKITTWAKEFDSDFYALLSRDTAYTQAIFSIDRDCAKPRKDIAKWTEAKDYVSYFFEELFNPDYTLPENIEVTDAVAFLKAYKEVYDENDDRQAWFDKIKALCPALNFASETKAYKANPELFKGHAGDLSTVLRIAVTGRRNTPDLCSIMKVMGKDKCMERIDRAISSVK